MPKAKSMGSAFGVIALGALVWGCAVSVAQRVDGWDGPPAEPWREDAQKPPQGAPQWCRPGGESDDGDRDPEHQTYVGVAKRAESRQESLRRAYEAALEALANSLGVEVAVNTVSSLDEFEIEDGGTVVFGARRGDRTHQAQGIEPLDSFSRFDPAGGYEACLKLGMRRDVWAAAKRKLAPRVALAVTCSAESGSGVIACPPRAVELIANAGALRSHKVVGAELFAADSGAEAVDVEEVAAYLLNVRLHVDCQSGDSAASRGQARAFAAADWIFEDGRVEATLQTPLVRAEEASCPSAQPLALRRAAAELAGSLGGLLPSRRRRAAPF